MEMGPIGEKGGPDQEPPSSYSRPAAVWTGPRLMRQIGRDRRDCPHPPGRGSIPLEILEPRRAQLCVARGVRDRHVAEPILDRPGIDPVVGQLVAARVAQHVEVDRPRQLGAVADVLDQPVDGVGGERRPALGGEHVAVVGERLTQRRQHPQLIAPDRVNTGLAALGPPDMQRGRSPKLHLRPFQLASLLGAQAVTVGSGWRPDAPAARLRRLDEADIEHPFRVRLMSTSVQGMLEFWDDRRRRRSKPL